MCGSVCKTRLPDRPGNRAASPGREMERERLKTEPEARGRGAARLHPGGCTAGPGAASPPAAPAPQGAAGGSSRRMFCSYCWLLQLPRPPPDEIRPRDISGSCKTPPLPRACGPGRGRAGGTRWPLGAVPLLGTPWICPSPSAGSTEPGTRKQRGQGTGPGARSALRRSAVGPHCSPRAKEAARSPPGPFPGRRPFVPALPSITAGSRHRVAVTGPRPLRGCISSSGEGSDRTPLRREPPHRHPGGLRGQGRRLLPGASPRPSLPSSLSLLSLLPQREFAARFPGAHPAPQPR